MAFMGLDFQGKYTLANVPDSMVNVHTGSCIFFAKVSMGKFTLK